MKILFVTGRHWRRWTLSLSLTFLILLTLSLSVSRVLLPKVTEYHPEIEKHLSRSLDSPVRFQNVSATWWGWKLQLRLDQFRLGVSQQQLPWVVFDKGFIEIDLFRSLLKGRIVVSKLRANGLHLAAEQDPSGRLRFGPESSDPLSFQFDQLASHFSDLHALDLVIQQITLRPSNKIGPVRVVRDLRVTLRRDKQTRRLAVVGDLPQQLGQWARAVLEWRGRIDDFMTAEFRFYLQGKALKLANWPLPKQISSGQIALFEAWGDWQQGRVETLDGRVQMEKLTTAAIPSLAGVRKLLTQMPSLSADFSWRRRLQGWDWQGNLVGKDAHGVMDLQSAAKITALSGATSAHVEGYLNNLRLDDIATLINPWLQETSPLLAMQPRGRVSALAFRVPLEKGKLNRLQHYTLVARLRGVTTQPWRRIPGVQGLQGVLAIDQEGGRIDLDSHKLRITGEKLFRAPVSIDRLVGPLRWWRGANGLHLASTGLNFHNGDFKAQVQGHVALLDTAASPYLNLKLTTQALQLGQVHHYLPTPLMHPKLSAWLDRALAGGHVTQGTVVLRGYAEDFPFDNGQGLFKARLQLRDAILDYARHWPRLEALQGEVLFRNRALRINAVEGKIFDVDLQHATAQIDDLAKGELDIQGSVQGSGAKMANFLQAGPLAKRVGKRMQGIQATGTNTLDLHLRIPLRKIRSLQVQGAVHFAGGKLTLPRWQLDLNRINGTVKFTRQGLQAQGLTLALREQPARMDIATGYDKFHGRETRFVLRGRFGVQTLLGRHSGLVEPYLDGRADWKVVVKAPSSGDIQLDLTSDLQGMAVNLPGSLVKPPQKARAFSARIEPQSNNKLFCRLTYGSSVQAAIELAGFPGKPQLARGELRIESGVARLPQQPGLMVIAHLPRFALGTAVTGEIQKARQWPAWLRGIEIQFQELALAGQRFSDVNLKVALEDDGLALQLDSKNLAGRVYLPAQATPNTPVGVQLQRLWLSRKGTSAGTAGKGLDPDGIPPLWVTVEELIWDGRALGKLRFGVMPEVRGLRLTHLQLNGDEHRISASGHWWHKTANVVSHLNATLTSQNLGKTLRAFGYEDALKEGEAKAKLAAQWTAPFPDIAPELINGDLELTIAKGRLLEVEPGLGRLVGLLNIGSLSRRLQLDFSDLFKEGLGFDQLKGNVRFGNGYAYNSVVIMAPAAQVHLMGRIGFRERDYRQTVTVTPQIGSPLAIAGAIAGGPAVGAAVLFAERIFKPGIDQITRYQYLITGSWDDPVVQPRKVPVVVDPYSIRGGG